MTVTSSRFAPQPNQLYETETWAIEALLRALIIPQSYKVWEPAAGNHRIADCIRSKGIDVYTSDIAVYDREHDDMYDFLADPEKPRNFDAIITNPPYGAGNRLAVKFCEKALERCDGYVAMLLTAKFDFGKTRHHLFRDNKRFTAKVNLVDRIQWFPGDYSGTEDHAWYIWGPTTSTKKVPELFYEGKE